MTNEVYQSSTLGPIPLSFTGRHLLHNLRDAITEALYAKPTPPDWKPVSPDWKPISLARGRIAQYISRLETEKQKLPVLKEIPTIVLLEELRSRELDRIASSESVVNGKTGINKAILCGEQYTQPPDLYKWRSDK